MALEMENPYLQLQEIAMVITEAAKGR